jgi:hypothetical protein
MAIISTIEAITVHCDAFRHPGRTHQMHPHRCWGLLDFPDGLRYDLWVPAMIETWAPRTGHRKPP